MLKKTALSLTLLLSCFLGGLWAYYEYLRPFRIATIGFSDTDWANWEDAIRQTSYSIHRFDVAGIDTANLSNYNLVFIRGQGLNLSTIQVDRIAAARARGTHFYVRTATNALSEQQTSVPEEHRQKISDYMRHGGEENLIGMAHYAAHHLGGRSVKVPELIERPTFGFFHLGEQVFETLEQYEQFQASRGIEAQSDRPRVAMIGNFMDPQDSMNREPIDQMLTALENAGAKVYPIFGRAELFDLLRSIKPDLVLTFPHGRMGQDNQAEKLLKELDCPVISALPLMTSREKWLEDERGMEGGFLGQSITSPELDGIIEPVVVSSMEPNERRINVRWPMEDQLQARVTLAMNWLKLRKTPNSKKRLVIVYYKSPGMAALSAGGLEVAPALWNTLKRLESEGYDLGGQIPETPDQLFELIQTKGKTIGQWALGTFESFLKEAEPELVPAEAYAKWFQSTLSSKRQQETIDLWGELPGKKMVTSVDGKPHLVISRIKLGNVVIMPQPTVGGGDENENEISSIHGTDQAAPHFYLGAYLWARYGFKADAIMHFGTHGSLEFTYGKSNCLSRDCWPQILIGDVPHIYPYIINNVGEALVAKRRSNAVIVSHLTPPFMESGLYGELSLLHDKIHDWQQVEDPLLREETLKSVTELVRQLNLTEDLGMEKGVLDSRLLTESELTEIHNYIHQLKDQSVTDGLHVIGREFTDAQIQQTVTAMLGQQGVDQLLTSLGKFQDDQAMEIRQELANQFVSSVLNESVTVDALFTPEQISAMKQAVEAQRSAPTGSRGRGRPGSGTGHPGGAAGHPGSSGHPGASGHPGDSSGHPSAAGHPGERPVAGAKSQAGQRSQELPGSEPAGTRPTGPRSAEDKPAEKPVGNDANKVQSIELDKQSSTSVKHHLYSRNQVRLVAVQANTQETPQESNQANTQLDAQPPRDETVVRARDKGPQDKADDNQTNAQAQPQPAWNSLEELKSWIGPQLELQQSLVETIDSIKQNATNLKSSPAMELQEIIAALNAEYIAPSSGGDPLVNPSSVPTGRNLYSINAEQTPSTEAWRVAMKLVDQMLAAHRDTHGGQYPRQVAISFWGGEFIRGKGTEIAQALYLIGMRPVWNSRGVVFDVEVIPASELNRPRVDVLVQTSGQFRDAAASRIALLDKAVQIASSLEPDDQPNYVREGTEQTELALKAKGVSAKDARDFATARIFGSASNSSYGTQIMGMVEKGGTWQDAGQVAQQYIKNMSGVYRDGDRWGTVLPGLLEAQMQGVDAVVHPRSSNTWGPLSLDHVYEFMGGITLAVRETTGKDPTGYFSDLRQPGRAKVTTSIGAIREEARTALWNPKFIQGLQREGPSAAASLTETVRNMYGWNVMQPSAISRDMWDETYRVYIEDKHNLNMREYFEQKNPYALQDMTAVMLETARKGYWQPDSKVLQKLAQLHTELVASHGAACSYETCGNAAFREFMQQQLNAPGYDTNPQMLSDYQQALASALNPTQTAPEVQGIELNEVKDQIVDQPERDPLDRPSKLILISFLFVACILGYGTIRRSESHR